MEPNIKIDESLIPMNFGWRAGIGTCVDDVVDSFERRKKEYEDSGNLPIEREFLNEYNDSLWWSLVADVEDAVKQFLYEPMCESMFASMQATIKQIIDNDIAKYPYMKSYSFHMFLKELRKQVIDELMLELESYKSEHTSHCDGWFFTIDDYNTLVINKNRILNYILFEY